MMEGVSGWIVRSRRWGMEWEEWWNEGDSKKCDGGKNDECMGIGLKELVIGVLDQRAMERLE